jgi:hypothetical protein
MALTQENILGSFLPTVNISKILLNTGRVDLEMAIIDTDFDEGIFSVINDKFLRDCITIKVYQSLSERVTERLLDGEEVGIPIEIPITNTTSFEVDEEGNRILYYSVSFDLDTSKLEHLSYAVFSDIDVRQLRNQFEITLTTEELKDIPKKINIDTVIDNSQVVSTSYIYQLPDGTIWNGEVINLNGVFQTLEENARVLLELEVPNYKIQDFRLRNIVQKNSVNEEFVKYSDILIEDTFIPQANLDIPILKPKVFENITKCQNTDKTVSISILMNINELIKQNCLFPKLLKNSLINQRSILSNMSLYRRQVKNVLNNNGKTTIELEENKEPELILTNFINYSLNVEPNTNHFLLRDENIKYATNGKYQYGIQIKFFDPTVSELKKRLVKALSIRKNMVEYSKFCEAFIDPNTNYFKKEVVEVWDVEEVEAHAEEYLQAEFNLPEDFNRVDFLRNLKANISPINGTIEGIYIFLKMVDDLINDISFLLSITNNSTDIYEFDRTDIEQYSIKSSVEIFHYFNEAIHDIEQFSSLQISYLNIRNGIVSSRDFSNSLFPTTQTKDALYIAPKTVVFKDQVIPLSSIESETKESVKKQKYSLLKDKINEAQQDKNFFNDPKKFDYLKNKISDKTNIIAEMKTYRNSAIRQNIFNSDSVVMENNPALARDFEKFNSLDKVLYPENNILIEETQTKVNILKNLTINLNDDEQRFKFLMLNKVEYLEKDQNTSMFQWRELTLDKINEFINNSRFNIICRLVAYDYGAVNVEINNINNFTYNKNFILNLRNFNFTPRTEEAQIVPVITEPVSLPNEETPPPPPRANIIRRPIKNDLIKEIIKDQKQQTNELFKEIIPVSKLPKNIISRATVAASTTKTNVNKNFNKTRISKINR